VGSWGHWFSVIFALSFQEDRMLIANQQYWSTNSKHGYYQLVSTLAVIFFMSLPGAGFCCRAIPAPARSGMPVN
jgi:hypothetical protein